MKFIALDDVLLAFVLLRTGSGINHLAAKQSLSTSKWKRPKVRNKPFHG